MICILAGNYQEAYTYARGQNFTKDEWFYPTDEQDLYCRRDFHVLVVGTAGQNVPGGYFERIYNLALQRGRMK